jgi:hypothetical protein
VQRATLLRRPGTSVNEKQKGVAQAAPFLFVARKFQPSFRDAPLGAGPESILTMVVMDSGLAASSRPGMTA